VAGASFFWVNRQMAEEDGLQRFLAVAADHRLLTARDEKTLGKRAQQGDRAARDELVLSNIRLVVSIARYYRNRGLPMEDVIQHGIIGLNRAAEKFDPSKDIRFSTYATLWIKQAIQRGIASGGAAIRLPSTVASNRAKVRAERARHPDATTEFIADLLDLDTGEVERALDAAEVVTSLDREVQSDDFTHTMLDAMPDTFAEDPYDLVTDDLSDELRTALAAMDREHRRVIELAFGLTGKQPMTVAEMAKAIKRNGKPVSVNTVKTLRAEGIEFLGYRLDHHA
jgi:RNA polymerase sigma factor (sigma-70 family)